jgi:FKBP-type peptidyl-prolyl cis-trans isomerase
MRRPLIALIAGLLVLAACGGDDNDEGAASTLAETTVAGSASETTVTETSEAPGTSGPPATSAPATSAPATSAPATSAPAASVPEVELPDPTPTELEVTVITEGSGPPAADGDSVFVNYVGVRSEDGTEFDNNYGSDPFPVTLGAGGVIEGWDQGLQGAQAGSQIQLDIPADLAYGDEPQGEVIQPGDALSFVIDVLAVVPQVDPADAPAPADVPTSDEAATEVAVEELTPGDGATLEDGGSGVVHLVAARGDNGEVLQSTWESGQPQVVVLDANLLLPALADGLEGMQVGGRRAVTIPQAELGADVASSLGLPADVNVVVIADLFAVL